ncbi:MAG: sigma-70 family RNA polymerase sigma factor [Dehalococcoidia bacterium]
MDDRQLIDLARGGSPGAFDGLVERYQDVAYRVALLITSDADAAADAAQEAFLKAYFALDRFKLDAPFRPWLLRIVANEARNSRKAAGRRERLGWRVQERAPTVAPDSPEEETLLAEQRGTLLAAIEQLRGEDRAVIAYRYFLDLSEAEMAEALKCRPGTVKSRLSRALGRLRGVLVADRDAGQATSPREATIDG